MRTTHQLLLTYWRPFATNDLRTLQQQTAGHRAGVYDAMFETWRSEALAMTASFDDSDPNAVAAAIQVAVDNLTILTRGKYRNLLIHLDGRDVAEFGAKKLYG